MALTTLEIKNAAPGETDYTLADASGLFMIVKPTGSKLWRFRYRLEGKLQRLSLGVYPDVSLSRARSNAGNARDKLAKGISLVDERREKKGAI